MDNNKSIIELIRKDYKNNKEQWDKMLNEGTKRKYKECTNKDGSFNYLKMSEMYHRGEW